MAGLRRKPIWFFGAVLLAGTVLFLVSKKPKTLVVDKTTISDQGLSSQAATRAPAAEPAATAPQVTAHDRELEKILTEILTARRDNDPRLDSMFNNMSEGTKILLREKYANLKPEARNDRGTIVFLIARDLKNGGTPEDFKFLDQVASEQPCLSLEDCSKSVTSHSRHDDGAGGTTLEYPQRVLIYTLNQHLEKQAELGIDTLRPPMFHTLEVLAQSPNPSIAQKARELTARYKK